MSAAWAIAINTFREAVRDKILYVLMAFGLLMILISRVVGDISYLGEKKMPVDVALAAVWFFSALISIFVGTGLIYKEIDKRTLYGILSKPIERWSFLLGKYLGLLLTTLVCLSALGVSLGLYLWLLGAPLSLALLQAVALIFAEMTLVTALAIFFSSVSTPILSAIFTTLFFMAGQMTKWIVDMGATLFAAQPWAGKLVHGVYLFLPNLHNFNVRQDAVHAAAKGLPTAISWSEFFSIAAYGLSYSLAVFFVALLFFRRRSF
jgi:ABC-type transport system involved in multi-copper enzyme maturation permease subunit